MSRDSFYHQVGVEKFLFAMGSGGRLITGQNAKTKRPKCSAINGTPLPEAQRQLVKGYWVRYRHFL